jgi:hypothetical protein
MEDTLWSILIRFAVNLVVLLILIRLIYYRFARKEEFVFSFIFMGIVIFLICSLLGTVDIQIGMALGLFAIFGILRFRTVNFTTKDMTYFFSVIGVSIINSQANIPPPVLGAVVVNSIIIISALVLEISLKKKILQSYVVKFNKPELLKPALRADLIKELSVHTGLDIVKVSIHEFDIVKGSAEVEIFYNNGFFSDEIRH